MFYVVAMAAAYVLALGPEPRLFGRPMLYEPPYAWLMWLPGFATLRVPARFAMLGVLCQSMLLAIVVARLSAVWRKPLMLAAICAAVLADGRLAELFRGLDFSRMDDQAGNFSALIQEIWRLFLVAMMIALIVEAALCLPRLNPQVVNPPTDGWSMASVNSPANGERGGERTGDRVVDRGRV